MQALQIEPLVRTHRSMLADFRCQHGSLAEYLRRYALRHVEGDLLARTYVAIYRDENVKRVAGYFSLTTVSVERSSVGEIQGLSRLPRFPIPGVLLARLAVDERVQGQGLGRYLFEEALGLTLGLAVDGPVTFRLLVTDAIDKSAVEFYEHFGLVRLSSDVPARMVLDLEPLLNRSR